MSAITASKRSRKDRSSDHVLVASMAASIQGASMLGARTLEESGSFAQNALTLTANLSLVLTYQVLETLASVKTVEVLLSMASVWVKVFQGILCSSWSEVAPIVLLLKGLPHLKIALDKVKRVKDQM